MGLCGRAALCKQFFPHQWVVGIGKQKGRNNKYFIKVPKNRDWQIIDVNLLLIIHTSFVNLSSLQKLDLQYYSKKEKKAVF